MRAWIARKLAVGIALVGAWGLVTAALQAPGAGPSADLGASGHAPVEVAPDRGLAGGLASMPPMARSESSLLADPVTGLTAAFCAEWNPEFAFRGARCCGDLPVRLRRKGIRCNPARAKRSYCDEMTHEQQRYLQATMIGTGVDVLAGIDQALGGNRQQAFCSTRNGFLAWGRPVVPSPHNRIHIRRPDRCVNFGTDRMTGMLEWVGRQFAARYSAPEFGGAHLLVGDISAPRGGCLVGRGGRRGHASHTAGQDADVGFVNASPNRVSPSTYGSLRFNAADNWWLMKQIFNNPYACVKVVFLDRAHIRRLGKAAVGDPEWARVKPFIRHYRRHQDHFHVRVGSHAGPPGCAEPIEADESSTEV